MNEHPPTEGTEIEAGQPGPTEQSIDKTTDTDTITASDEPDQKILTPETPTNAPATSETKSPGRNGNDEVRKAADEDEGNVEEAEDLEPPPRIYVASLSDYNAGILHGRWIDADPDEAIMQEQINTMLQASPTTARYGEPAEEWAIHDYEGFGDLRLDEFESTASVAKWADGIQQHGPAFAAWVAHVGERNDSSIERFQDRYQGEWETTQAYAEYMLDELGAERIISEAPDWLQPYLKLDVAGFARDLELGGDITTAETPDGKVWVWSGW